MFSKFPIGFNGFQIMCFKSVFKKFPIDFNDFQMMCFTEFSNNVFQSVFKIPHRFQWFSNCVFKMSFKVFSNNVSKCFQNSP